MKRLITLLGYLCFLWMTFVAGAASVKIASAQTPPPYVPCSTTALPEFHSLRPYQASPCDTRLLDLDLYCGNDLLAVDTITVGYGDAESCTQIAPNRYLCEFEVEREVDFSVDLVHAELPIAGNTQLVPNQVNGGDPAPERFKAERLVNEYLSWYFNGVTYRAEEPLVNVYSDLTVDEITKHVTFSGPIKKLIPQYIQRERRQRTINNVGSGDPGTARHNQVVYCTLFGNQVPCTDNYTTNIGGIDFPLSIHRLTDTSPEQPYIPTSTTEDRLGEIVASADGTVQPDQEGGVSVSNFELELETQRDLLYFPHLHEDADLAHLFQQTYLPAGSWGAYINPNEPLVFYNTYRCDFEDVRWNTGDDLFGEFSGDLQILDPAYADGHSEDPVTGQIDYTANFSCEIEYGTDQACYDSTYNQCINNEGEFFCDPASPPLGLPSCIVYCQTVANDRCSNNGTCERQAVTAVSMYTRTPKTEELWDRTVAGRESIAKRIWPQIGHNGMFEEIKDFPAVTTARYLSDTENVDIFAGERGSNRSGERGEIYIPHLGGIYEFFLIGIQDTLRPQIMGSRYLSQGLPPGTGEAGTCDEAPYPCDPANLLAQGFDANSEAASNASQICNLESSGNPRAANISCLSGGTYDFSIGLFQINLLAGRCPGAFSLLDPDNSYCEINIEPGVTCSDLIPSLNACNSALRECIIHFQNAENNIEYAVGLSNHGQTFSTHWVNASNECSIP